LQCSSDEKLEPIIKIFGFLISVWRVCTMYSNTVHPKCCKHVRGCQHTICFLSLTHAQYCKYSFTRTMYQPCVITFNIKVNWPTYIVKLSYKKVITSYNKVIRTLPASLRWLFYDILIFIKFKAFLNCNILHADIIYAKKAKVGTQVSGMMF